MLLLLPLLEERHNPQKINNGTCSFNSKYTFMKMKACIWGGKGKGNVLKKTTVPAHKYINSSHPTLIFKYCRII